MKLLLAIFAILTACALPAQSITEDPLISEMMANFIRFNKEHQEVRGWRVQILVTTDRRQMERAKSRFENTYPEYKLFFSHENPFYHLKTGAFQSRENARPFLRKIRNDFPGAFLVTDDIELEEVLVYQ